MDIDSATRARLRLLYPDFSVRVIRVLEDMWKLHGRAMRVTEGLRTLEAQTKLYAQGRTAPGPIVTRAKPGDSIHHYGLASDCCFVGPDPYCVKDKDGEFLWEEYGRLSQAHGLTWGADWNGNGIKEKQDFDRPHIEQTYGLTLDYIKILYRFKGTEAVWARCDQMRGVPQGSEWYGPLTKTKLMDLGRLD